MWVHANVFGMRKAVGTDYELTEPIEYSFDFQAGTNRIEMEVVRNEHYLVCL